MVIQTSADTRERGHLAERNDGRRTRFLLARRRGAASLGPAPLRAALLINCIAPYRLPLLERLNDRVAGLRVFVSTAMEADRHWRPDWGTLDVVRQRTVTILLKFRRRTTGNVQQPYLHFPFDTLPLLHRYGPDVVVSCELGFRSLLAALYRRLTPRCRLVIWATLSERTESDWGPVRRLVRRVILRGADAAVVNGRSGARYIRGLDAHVPITVMNQPVDLGFFSRAAADRRTRPTV